MKVETLKPFGCSARGVDINKTEHVATLRLLVIDHGVVVVPANSVAEGAPPVHEVNSMSLLARKLGTIPEYHPDYEINDVGVQLLTTSLSNIPGSRQPEAYLYHVDSAWGPKPCLIGALECVEHPKGGGGNTIFADTSVLYDRLPEHLKKQLENLYAVNSYSQNLKGLRLSHALKRAGYVDGIHPAVIRHPYSKKPILYISENPTSGFLDVSEEESDALLKEGFYFMYAPGYPRYEHAWTQGDTVLWDDIGLQNFGRSDYTGKRVMARVLSRENIGNRTERYLNENHTALEAGAKFENLFTADEETTEKLAYRYENDMESAGYTATAVAADLLHVCMKRVAQADGKLMKDVRVLDVAAGTGVLGLRMLQTHGVDRVLEYVDQSTAMMKDAKRRVLYKKYETRDVNQGLTARDGEYNVVTCINGLSEDWIGVSHGLKECTRVTQKRGFVIVVTSSDEVCGMMGKATGLRVMEKKKFEGCEKMAGGKQMTCVLAEKVE